MRTQLYTRQHLVGVSSLIPAQLENELRNTCACMRHESGLDYAETFSEVVRLGLQSIQAKRASALAQGVEVLRKVSR